MQMYDVTVLAEDMKTQMLNKIIFAEDEDDAMNQMEAELKEKSISYSMCMAEEIE